MSFTYIFRIYNYMCMSQSFKKFRGLSSCKFGANGRKNLEGSVIFALKIRWYISHHFESRIADQAPCKSLRVISSPSMVQPNRHLVRIQTTLGNFTPSLWSRRQKMKVFSSLGLAASESPLLIIFYKEDTRTSLSSIGLPLYRLLTPQATT